MLLPSHHDALQASLVAARHDHTEAMTGVLRVAQDLTGADEVRMVLLDGPGLETWRLRRGDRRATVAINLDASTEHGAWREEVSRAQQRTVVLCPLPRAPGIDAGVLAADVPPTAHLRERASANLELIALATSCIASAARSDVERRVAVDAALDMQRAD